MVLNRFTTATKHLYPLNVFRLAIWIHEWAESAFLLVRGATWSCQLFSHYLHACGGWLLTTHWANFDELEPLLRPNVSPSSERSRPKQMEFWSRTIAGSIRTTFKAVVTPASISCWPIRRAMPQILPSSVAFSTASLSDAGSARGRRA